MAELGVRDGLPVGSGSSKAFARALARLAAVHDSEVAQLRAQLREGRRAPRRTEDQEVRFEESAYQFDGACGAESGRKTSKGSMILEDCQDASPEAEEFANKRNAFWTSRGQVVQATRGQVSKWSEEIEALEPPIEGWEQLTKGITSPHHDHRKRTGVRWELLPMWTVRRSSAKVDPRQLKQQDRETRAVISAVSKVGDAERESSCLQPLVAKPSSFTVFCWRMLGAVCIVVDTLIIPVQVAALSDFSETLDTVTTATLVYWLLDLIYNFFIGEEVDGIVEMRPSRIARKYIRSWFLLDLTVVLIDLLLISLDLEFGTTVRLVKILRLFRFARLLRTCKLRHIQDSIIYRMNSYALILFTKIMMMVVGIMIVNHYVACVWYAIALHSSRRETWLAQYGIEQWEFSAQYISSLHWSLTQFAPSTNNISPQNQEERSFSIGVVLFGMVVYSSFISSITNAINQLRSINMPRIQEEARVLEFICSRHISRNLALRIQTFIGDYNRKSAKCVQEKDIRILQEIPESLKILMHQEVYMPFFESHPMMSHYLDLDRPLLIKLCHVAFMEQKYLPHQDAFIDGFEASEVKIVVTGRLSYTSAFSHDVTDIAHGVWLAEMALWAKWTHRGQLTARSTSDVALLNCARFQVVVAAAGGPLLDCLRKFALFYVSHVQDCEDGGKYTTDLPLEKETVTGMSRRAKKMWIVAANTGDLLNF